MKRFLFTAAMILLPILFFGMVEGVLRLSGFGDSYPLFVPVEGKPEYLYQNREVARSYFTHIENIPTSLSDFFEARKDSSTFRIVVQGASSAAGFPFYYGGAFSRMLEQRLIQTFPERHVEVINTSMAATNSYTLLDLSDEIIEQEPDAVLIYVGHNEYYGALGVGSSESLGRYPWMVRTYLAVADWRIVQALRKGFAWTVKKLHGGRRSTTLMQGMVGKEAIPYGSREYRLGLSQFRSNLSRLLVKYAERHIPVFIGTVASNERDHEPFVGENARAYFAQGRELEREGRFEEARTAYVAAKDHDELRFRAPEEMNEIVREEAARHGAHLVESREALSQASPNGIIGSEMMMEHLHPNVNGYFVISDAFYEALRREHLIGDWSHAVPRDVARAEILLTPVDSLVGDFRVRQLKSAWPFQPPGVVTRWIGSVKDDDPVVRIALDLFQEKVSWIMANEALRRYYEEKGEYHLALQAALAQIQEYPFIASPYLAAGNNLIKQHRYAEALGYFEAANAEEETAAAHRMIGSILLQRGEREAALPHLERAVAMDPKDLAALYNLSGAYALEGRYDLARATVIKLLSLEPRHQDGRRLLASLPKS